MTPEISKFALVMYKMFPLFKVSDNSDNLTEIPTPHKTLHQRFMTISESEPFGPIEAARVLDLPVASDTLAELSEFKQETDQVHQNKVVIGIQRQGDRSVFKFTLARSGQVGHRYGASRRDRKKDRSVAFDRQGKLIYV